MSEKPPITLSSVAVCSDAPLTAEVDGEVVLMSVSDGMYFGLNTVGSDIWRRLAQPTRVADLCAALSADYEGDAAQIERDVLTLLTKLVERQLVEIRE